MDEIQKRLKETSETCIAVYEKWAGNKKNSEASESLQEAIHELRKVASRLEIELAISERDENAAKPLPIPPHRAAQRGGNGNGDEDYGQQPQHHQPRQGRGGGGGGGRGRPHHHRKSAGGGGGKGGNE